MNVALDADVVLSLTRLFYMCIIYHFSVYVVSFLASFPLHLHNPLYKEPNRIYKCLENNLCGTLYCQAISGDISRYSILMILSTKGHSDEAH